MIKGKIDAPFLSKFNRNSVYLDSDDEFYREPEIVNRRDLEAMYPDGVPESIIIDDFLGPTKPDNGKGRR